MANNNPSNQDIFGQLMGIDWASVLNMYQPSGGRRQRGMAHQNPMDPIQSIHPIQDSVGQVPMSNNPSGQNGPNGSPSTQPHPITVDIVNEDQYMYIYVETPGVPRENIEIQFRNNKVIISIEKNRIYGVPEMAEIKYGKFERTLALPICITRRDSVTLSYNHGLTRIKIDKSVQDSNFSLRFQNQNDSSERVAFQDEVD